MHLDSVLIFFFFLGASKTNIFWQDLNIVLLCILGCNLMEDMLLL